VTDPADEEEEPAKQKKSEKKAAPAVTEEDDIPEELKGKTPAQLAKMYRDAQSVIGRQGSELGDLRRAADEYIKDSLRTAVTRATSAAPAKAEVKAPDTVDFFTDPANSVAKIIENHPALKALEGKVQEATALEIQRKRYESKREFDAAHPDAKEVLADQDFRAWVDKSPIRRAMMLRAHQHYDFAAGNEVFSTWKELKAARTPAQPAATGKTAVKSAGKEAARVPTGGNAAPRTASTTKEGKIFRRADVIRLMEQDPDRYAAMGEELTKAYSEGRVR
jgi:hypothetical protein